MKRARVGRRAPARTDAAGRWGAAPRPPRGVLALALGAAVALLGGGLGCRSRSAAPPAPPSSFAAHRGPVVLITIDALRADVVARPLTPSLAAFRDAADWAGTAIAASSWTAPAMATIFTGLQPWSHGVLHPGRAKLADSLLTLPEAMHEAGLATVAFQSNHWLSGKFGYAAGFDSFRRAGSSVGRPVELLSGIDGSPRFVWVHVLPPHAPYLRHERFLDRLDDPPANLPERVRPIDLEPDYDPQIRAPADELRRFHALYRLNAAFADQLAGRLLAAVRRSGHWDDALIVVTADHGEEFEEHGQTGHGGNLGRELIEVPLFVKLPRGFGASIAPPTTARPAMSRLYATLLEAVGATPPPDAAPSLLRPAAVPALSELYLGASTNELSLVEGSRQLRWISCFAPPEPEYYRARLASLGGHPEPPPSEPPQTIFDRLLHAFEVTLPLSGSAAACAPHWILEDWRGEGGATVVDDPARARTLARELRAAWRAANGEEVAASQRGEGAPTALEDEDVKKVKALGYVP